jgi:hypothetical protein
MSLKAFHIVFITAACILAVGCGIWGIREYRAAAGTTGDLLFGLGSFAAAAGLVLYERYYLKKNKDVKYL